MKKLLVSYHCCDEIRVARRREYVDRFNANLRALDKKACEGKLPNGDWYRPVRGGNGEIYGYICGRGLHVATTLSMNMVPKGIMV